MPLNLDEIKSQIRSKGLRVTSARLAVLKLFFEAKNPLSHGNVVNLLQKNIGDQATLYRILVKFKEVGLLRIASKANGINRYELFKDSQDKFQQKHPHFVCDDCGAVSCLPETTVVIEKNDSWYQSLSLAQMQFIGTCQLCLP